MAHPDLCCPCCRRSFPFGRECPVCDVSLADSSAAALLTMRAPCTCERKRVPGLLDRIGNGALRTMGVLAVPAVIVGFFGLLVLALAQKIHGIHW